MDDDVMEEFLAVSWDHLSRLEAQVLALRQQPGDAALLDTISGLLQTLTETCVSHGLERIGRFALAAENVLARFRDRSLRVEPDGVATVIETIDHIQDLLTGLEATREEPDLDAAALLHKLDALAASATLPSDAPALAAATGDGVATPSSIPGTGDALDRLLILAEELAALRDELQQLLHGHADGRFTESLARFSRIVGELHDAVRATRCRPIGSVWRSLPRLVRELCVITGKPIELTLHGAETPLDRSVLAAIKDPLRQLIRNAAEHGIEPSADRRSIGKPAAGRLTLSAVVDNGELTIALADDGDGIECERLAGLNAVRKEIACLGGRLEIASEIGEGTTVRLFLPLSEERGLMPNLAALETSPEIITEEPTAPEPPSPRVLVIDDSMFFRQLLRMALEAECYEVATAENVDRAIATLEDQRFDAILCELELPGRSGCEFAAWLRSRPEFAEIPLIAMTSLDGDEHRVRAIEAGFQRVLVKFLPQELRDTLAELAPQTAAVHPEISERGRQPPVCGDERSNRNPGG